MFVMNNQMVMKRYLLTLLAFAAMIPANASGIYHNNWIDFNKNGRKDVYEDPKQPVEKRIEDLLSQMTLEEKTCQLVTLYGCDRVLHEPLPTEGWKSRVWKDGIANIDEHLNGYKKSFDKFRPYIYPFSAHVEAIHETQRFFVERTRLGIPAEFSNEGIHGLTHALATPLPAPIAIGSSWDRDLVLEAGEIVGREARLLGYNSVYAPILDVARDQRWGRVLECYGEDPYLVARLGTQMAVGIQKYGVGAGLKHYAAYSVPKGGRDGAARTDPHITPRELHEIFLYPFREVIAAADPMVVMSSYNDWNGEPVTASHWFLTGLLRERFGFTGYVVSDSDAVEFVYNKHQVASSYEDAIRQVLEAGLNVKTNFEEPELFVDALRKGLSEGLISEKTVDDRVREVLRVKFRMGLFDNPYCGDGKIADEEVGLSRNAEFAKRICQEGMVLLKNEGGLLPLEKNALRKVLVTGPLADEDNFMTSRYGPNGHDCVTMLEGIRKYLGDSAEVVYEKGCNVVDTGWPESEIIPQPLSEEEKAGIRAAVEAAADVDVIVAVMGEDDLRTGESKSRTSLDLPGRQRDLLMALKETGKPIVLVLVNGQPLTVNWENAYLPAIVETWFPNCFGGTALAEVLFGDYNPSGKLTVTFPRTIGQIEYNFPYKKGSHGYQHKSGPNGSGRTRVQGPLYPFGYGLSYTTFEYSDIDVEICGRSEDGGFDSIDVTATITNTGSREGTEVVQLYVRDLVSSVVTYDSVLRGFERISLKPGESGRVEFTLTPKDLQILDKDMNWRVEPGEFELMLGASSTDIRQKKTVRLNCFFYFSGL